MFDMASNVDTLGGEGRDSDESEKIDGKQARGGFSKARNKPAGSE